MQNEVQHPTYDTKEGIAAYLTSLDGLNKLRRDRQEAGYKRKERMGDFLVLSTWHLDTCGNFGRIMEPKLTELCPDLPSVIFFKELWDFGNLAKDTSVSTNSMRSELPPARIECEVCKTKWSVKNTHDLVVKHHSEKVDLKDFVGQKLSEVRRIFGERSDAVYEMQNEVLIRNDRFINLDPVPGYETLKRNQGGWVGAAGTYTEERDGGAVDLENYVIQAGDDGHFNIWKFFHETCNRTYLRHAQLKAFKEIFDAAGFVGVLFDAIPNRYCPCEVCAPWFEVTTQAGIITIGWRKNVINIDWSKLTVPIATDAAFAGENVTKGDTYIHAWGNKKAVEYLTKIREATPKIIQKSPRLRGNQ